MSDARIPSDVRWVGNPGRKRDNSWQVPWVDLAAKKHSRTFRTDISAQEWANGCKALVEQRAIETDASIDFREPDGSTIWWTDLLSQLAYRIVTAQDIGEKEELRKDMSAVANGSKAVKGLIDMSEIERRVLIMEEDMAGIRAKRQNGAGVEGSFREA